jgi:protein-glutamine gamma-glutamyltransferase
LKPARNINWKEWWAAWLLLLLPTGAVMYNLLQHLNTYFVILDQQSLRQTFYFMAGCITASLLYSWRFRFIPSFLILVIIFYLGFHSIDWLATGEFDTFFASVQFLILGILFLLGWICGAGFVRVSFFGIIITAALIFIYILLLAHEKTFSLPYLLRNFIPILLYGFYIIYMSAVIHRFNDQSVHYWAYLFKRAAAFFIVLLILLAGVYFLMRPSFKQTTQQAAAASSQQKDNMLKKHKNGTFSMKDYTQLRGHQARGNELLFCAHLNNFFPDGTTPNPLYFAADYLTKFDTATETFEPDSLMPDNDFFSPDPSKIPLYFTKTDSTVIQNGMSNELRKVVSAEVYKKYLSPSSYVAPSTAFFCQPISVEKDFRNEFTSAYRAKMYVSDLNSAYFVYNIDDSTVRKFQQQRFDLLRQDTDYTAVDTTFMRYYTQMPSGITFDSIRALAARITQGVTTPVDKIIRIRDYFLSKNALGEPLFQYTDNPGIPGVPDASKLMYFLFQNRKGYCAYFAGATLFLLRACHIPSRMVVGFLTVDRSDKNKGWYWFYGDQAHAWVQVYFPGYGWLDFDTTIGNTEAHEAPRPDGTPPLQPPIAYLAAHGAVIRVDTVKKRLDITTDKLVFLDKEYNLSHPDLLHLDVSLASFMKDTNNISLAEVHPGDTVMAISYAEVFKNIVQGKSESVSSLMNRFPDPVPIDEIRIQIKGKKSPVALNQPAVKSKEINYVKIALTVLLSVVLLLILLLLLPTITYYYYRIKALQQSGSLQKQAYYNYRAARFLLNQLKIEGLPEQSPLQFAVWTDSHYHTLFTLFMQVYLKVKYSSSELSSEEVTIIRTFFLPFEKRIFRHFKRSRRLYSFINFYTFSHFYIHKDKIYLS